MGSPIITEGVKDMFMNDPSLFTLEEAEDGTVYVVNQDQFPLLCILVGGGIEEHTWSFIGDGTRSNPHR